MNNERKRLRFEILLERFFSNFHRIILTNLLFAVPSGLIFAVFYFLNKALFNGGIVIPVAMLAIIPLYPFYAGVVMVVRNIARGDEKVSVFSDFIGAVKLNFLPFLLHGVVLYAASVISYLSLSLYISMLSAGWFFYALLFFCIIIVLFVLYTAFYLPLMTITYDLPLRYVYKNSMLMSFGEFKNNFFTTLALAVVFGICFTITAFVGSATTLAIIFIALWVLLLPATCTFMYVFFIYDGMVSIIRNKEELKSDIASSIDKKVSELKDKQKQTEEVDVEDFSDIDIASLKDTDDYIFHNGRMVKQSALLRQIKAAQDNKDK